MLFPRCPSLQIPLGRSGDNRDRPINFCDAIYVDDPLAKAGKLAHGVSRAMELLALRDMLGFPDWAAELIESILSLSGHPASADKADWPELLRVLDPNYENLIARFRADHTTFL